MVTSPIAQDAREAALCRRRQLFDVFQVQRAATRGDNRRVVADDFQFLRSSSRRRSEQPLVEVRGDRRGAVDDDPGAARAGTVVDEPRNISGPAACFGGQQHRSAACRRVGDRSPRCGGHVRRPDQRERSLNNGRVDGHGQRICRHKEIERGGSSALSVTAPEEAFATANLGSCWGC